MTPKNVPVDRVRIFNRQGEQIGEFKAVVERSWVLGDEGRAQFTYATRKTDIVNKKILQYGNWLLVENSALPSWVGVIDTPRTWTARTVTVSAYTPEHVFTQRRGPFENEYVGIPALTFNYLIRLVNTAEPTIIRSGALAGTGISRQTLIVPKPLSEILQSLYERSREEYNWNPVINELGRLAVYGDWAAAIGLETSALLHEGKQGGNIESASSILVEDGDIVNDVLGFGEGMSWTSKPKQIITDPASAYEYGLRQKAEAFSGVTSLQTVKDNAISFVKANRNPTKTFKVNAINVGNTFDYIGLGNRLSLRLQNIGFTNDGVGYETRIKIVGMKYNPTSKNKIELTVEEILNV